jgi:hypothetical protein
VTSDFDARTAVERELVLRLAGLLWRLRRATSIETGLFQIDHDTVGPANPAANPPACDWLYDRNQRTDIARLDKDAEPNLIEAHLNVEIAARFLTLNRADSGAFERLNRYETALWRQVGQLLVTLEFLRQYPSLLRRRQRPLKIFPSSGV